MSDKNEPQVGPADPAPTDVQPGTTPKPSKPTVPPIPMTPRISLSDVAALVELAMTARLSQAERLWLEGVSAKLNQQFEQQARLAQAPPAGAAEA
jgi:hypothetical protein